MPEQAHRNSQQQPANNNYPILESQNITVNTHSNAPLNEGLNHDAEVAPNAPTNLSQLEDIEIFSPVEIITAEDFSDIFSKKRRYN